MGKVKVGKNTNLRIAVLIALTGMTLLYGLSIYGTRKESVIVVGICAVSILLVVVLRALMTKGSSSAGTLDQGRQADIADDLVETLSADIGEMALDDVEIEDIRLSKKRDSSFVPPGKTKLVSGYRIPGPVYIGRDNSFGDRASHIIDPRLIVRNAAENEEPGDTGYWPSYSQLSPEQRAEYLSWHQAGRPRTKELGYFYLWLYGVEYYVTAKGDSQEKRDILTRIVDELRVQQANYKGEIKKPHISGLIDYIGVRYLPKLLNSQLEYPHILPRPLLASEHIRIAKYANDGKNRPLPYDLALIWLMSTGQVKRSKALKEHFKEVVFLYRHAYESTTGGGISVPLSNKPLSIVHQGFASFVDLEKRTLQTPPNWTDPVASDLPLNSVKEAYGQAIRDVKKFIKGREAGGRIVDLLNSLPEYVPVTGNVSLQVFQRSLKSLAGKKIGFHEIQSLLGIEIGTKLTKAHVRSVCSALEKVGFSMVPDARYTPVNIENSSFVYLEERTHSLTKWSKPGLCLHAFGIACCKIKQPSGMSEKQTNYLQQLLEMLDVPGEREYLARFVPWAISVDMPATSLKVVLQDLDDLNLQKLRRHLLGFYIGCGGKIDKNLLKKIESVILTLGGDKNDIVQSLHQETASEIGAAERQGSECVALNQSMIESLVESTNTVKNTLSEALADDSDFDNNDHSATVAQADLIHSTAWHSGYLDQKHSEFSQWLTSQGSWPAETVEQKCSEIGIMADGALDKINDAAFEVFGESLVELGDPVEIYLDLLETE